MMEPIRLRILFKTKTKTKTKSLLSDSLAKDGLNRSWIVLKPNLKTISDLSSYILSSFHLHHACPHGLILSMDDFVLPPFESVCILKDKDIVRVKKKRSKSILKLGNRLNSTDTEELVDKEPVDNVVKLLDYKEFENESIGYESEPEEDEPVATLPVVKKASKKRKASKIIHNSKKKKKKSCPSEDSPTITADVQHVNTKNDKSDHLKCDLPQKVIVVKNDSSSSSSESDTSNTTEIDGRSNSKSTASIVRVDQLVSGRRNVELSDAAGGSKKGPSRSSRRKKAKRQWLREKAQNEKQQQQLLETSIHQGPSQNDDSDMEEDTVPVVIRPGHIRFEPIRKVAADQTEQQNHSPRETLQWNGITNKKKGQKWGTEKTQSWKRNDYNNDFTGEPLQLPITESAQPKIPASSVGPVNFDELRPYTSVPQEGDLVAYRLIELSSTWTPEPSSSRVGKVSWYDTESNRIMLIPVPEYPLAFKKEIDEDSAVLLDTSPYGEDGSLKIDFASLMDLRLVKQGNLDSSKASTDKEVTSAKESAESSSNLTNNRDAHANGTSQDNRKLNAWDEISQALSAKKAQLSQNDGWSQEEGSGRGSWSYRALRGSAMGPTMALLRAQNKL